MADTETRPAGLATRYANLVIRFRVSVIVGWLVLTVAVTLLLPDPSGAGGRDLDGFVSSDSPAIATEVASLRAFGFPLLSRTVMVQRDADGLSPYAQAEAVLRAVALTQGRYDDVEPILGALPLTNTLGLFPASTESGTTALTYLFMPPTAGFAAQSRAAHAFAAEQLTSTDDAFVGVTGSVPARVEQERIVEQSLPLVETATLAAIVLIVGLNFRSLVAPLVALGTAAISFLVTVRLAGSAGQLLGVSIPAELTPLVLALLLGVVTDYTIFFLSASQHALRRGADRLGSARTATAEFTPIVTVAGITVAAGAAALLAARSGFFRAFGPALAITVLVGLAVAVTLVPALMAALGRGAFWPSRPAAERTDPPVGQATSGSAIARRLARSMQSQARAVQLLTRPRVAIGVVVGCSTGLLLMAAPLAGVGLGMAFVPSLPESNEARVAARAAKDGFAEGILSPTVLLLQGTDVTSDRTALVRLGDLLDDRPGVAGVLGVGDVPPQLESRLLLAESGHAARYLIVLDDEPLGATAIATLDRIQADLPGLLTTAGLAAETEVGLAGDTALAAGLVASTKADLVRIATAALMVNLLLLVIFLRALIAPLFLLATSVLALAASLGLTTWVFQTVLGHDGLTFYVPFAAAVLLVALGSDYNIFGVGHIWKVARDRPLRAAIVEAVPRTTRAITAAGIALAASFGLIAVVPLRPFRELAFVMAVGILIDAIVVRSLLVPALLSLLGRANWWPASPPSAWRRHEHPDRSDLSDFAPG